MKLVLIDSTTLGEGVFALLREDPRLLARGIRLTPEMLHFEAAAQSTLLDILEGRDPAPDIPNEVLALVTAFMAQFLLDLTGPLAGSLWSVPSEASPADRARLALAALLRERLGLPSRQH